jgi:hypothetical protein
MSEWLLALLLCAVPFLVFGAIELAAHLRRRRDRAIAQRAKTRSPIARRSS